ncbi:hypothetical protein INR49_005418 [Caranx melampygus]|nr:hypothetical protein INR49_005418 [Caranx melampygus]
MQKATYYDNSGLFGSYSYPKPDSYNYGPAHQSYPTSNIENDYQGSVCPIQTSAVRPPTLKDSDLNGDCMRQSGSQSSNGSSQATSIGEQQAPPLSASSPSSNTPASQKKKSPSGSASSTSTPALTKQIFPWMKETRQNSKQKSNNCTTSGGHWRNCLFPRYLQRRRALISPRRKVGLHVHTEHIAMIPLCQ